MQEKSDAQLLGEYARQGSESAFGEIVARYTDLIYSAVLRQVGSSDLAGDVAQSVFIDLARKAPSLAGKLNENGTIVGWLYRGSRYALSKHLRAEHRRHNRENQAMQNLDPASESSPEWERIRPVLDEALAGLSEADRQAMLLRFFQNKGFHAIGAALGISDDAAQKRVGRGLEKLRAHLAGHGITTTAAMLSTVLAAKAVQTTPAGLAAKLAAAALAGTAAATGGTLTIMKLITLTPLKLGIISAGIIGGLGAGLALEHKALNTAQSENATLREQMGALDQLREENQLLAHLKVDTNELATLRGEHSELMRLRGEVGRLRSMPAPAPTGLPPAERSELAQLRAEHATELAARAAEQLRIDTVTALKELGVAVRISVKAKNADVFPTSFDEFANVQLPGGIRTDAFEFVDYGKPLPTTANPGYLLAREKQAFQRPTGRWVRYYLLVDTSAQEAGSDDGSFDTWEKNWLQRADADAAAKAAPSQ